jgi:hypothetical protein
MGLAAGGDEADGGIFDDGSGSWEGSGDSARLSGSASGAGEGAARLPPLKGRSVFTVDVGDRGGEGGCRGGDGDKIDGEHWSSGNIGAIISADWKGRGDGGVEDSSVDGGDVGDVVKYERGETRRLESSVLSLSSHCIMYSYSLFKEGAPLLSFINARWNPSIRESLEFC